MIHLTVFLIAAGSALLQVPARPGEDAQAVGTVESCSFATRSLPSAFRAGKEFAEGYRLFQAGATYLPEGITVKSVILLYHGRVGLTGDASRRLYAELDQVYDKISVDPLLKNVPSALPYCLADKRPSEGHYFAYYPKKIAKDTRAIVFLHGFGGNFLFYTYLLKEEFPDAVILLPSWGPSWHDGTKQYLDDMVQDMQRKKSLSIRAPCLMAISAGGPAGFRLYHEQPERFACYVSIASAPPPLIVPRLQSGLKILMVNGRQDSGFRIAGVQSIAAQLAERLPRFHFHVIDGDHFFLLSKRAETFRAIKAFLTKEAGWPPGASPAKPNAGGEAVDDPWRRPAPASWSPNGARQSLGQPTLGCSS